MLPLLPREPGLDISVPSVLLPPALNWAGFPQCGCISHGGCKPSSHSWLHAWARHAPKLCAGPYLFVTIPWSQGSGAEVLICPEKCGWVENSHSLPWPALSLAKSCCFVETLVPPRTRGWGQGYPVGDGGPVPVIQPGMRSVGCTRVLPTCPGVSRSCVMPCACGRWAWHTRSSHMHGGVN